MTSFLFLRKYNCSECKKHKILQAFPQCYGCGTSYKALSTDNPALSNRFFNMSVKSMSTEIKLTFHPEPGLSEHVYSFVTQRDVGTLSGKDKSEKE